MKTKKLPAPDIATRIMKQKGKSWPFEGVIYRPTGGGRSELEFPSGQKIQLSRTYTATELNIALFGLLVGLSSGRFESDSPWEKYARLRAAIGRLLLSGEPISTEDVGRLFGFNLESKDLEKGLDGFNAGQIFMASEHPADVQKLLKDLSLAVLSNPSSQMWASGNIS